MDWRYLLFPDLLRFFYFNEQNRRGSEALLSGLGRITGAGGELDWDKGGRCLKGGGGRQGNRANGSTPAFVEYEDSWICYETGRRIEPSRFSH